MLIRDDDLSEPTNDNNVDSLYNKRIFWHYLIVKAIWLFQPQRIYLFIPATKQFQRDIIDFIDFLKDKNNPPKSYLWPLHTFRKIMEFYESME